MQKFIMCPLSLENSFMQDFLNALSKVCRRPEARVRVVGAKLRK